MTRGAFGVFRSADVRKLDGAAYHLTARIAKNPRTADEWDISMLTKTHYDLFGEVFPGRAGQLRQTQVTFRHHSIPRPGQVLHRLHDICTEAQEIIRAAEPLRVDQRLARLLEQITVVHAKCVVVQPFIDGNKRWARHTLSALLVDIGYGPGTAFSLESKARYLEGIDKGIEGHPEQLGNLIIAGMQKIKAFVKPDDTSWLGRRNTGALKRGRLPLT